MAITKKLWNTLSKDTRKEYIDIIYGERYPSVYQWYIDNNYEHDFVHDEQGMRLKRLLSYGRLQSDGSIDVVLTIKHPTYAPKPVSVRSITNSVKKAVAKPAYCKWKVDYEDKSDDLCHVWVYASSSEEAEEKARDEYWDIKDILDCTPIRD